MDLGPLDDLVPRDDLVPLDGPVGDDHAYRGILARLRDELVPGEGWRTDVRDVMRTRYEYLVAGSPDPAVSWCNWVVRLREADCLTGFAQAIVTRSDQGSTAVISMVTGRPWQGRGIGGEAVVGMLGRLRSQGVDTVVADIHPDNHASAGAAARSGFTCTGELHDDKLRWQLHLSSRGSRR
ncbi:GNAT family N-acetyltransferase [Streptomyces sp. NPDC058534]|uniref:GNAT family N-acetyltransferase n=1 Tax=Streptomyces sp. NPDC058534 TaxID=3346541 RepID=UPI00366A364E